MRIMYDHERIVEMNIAGDGCRELSEDALMQTLEEAATLCIKKEGLSPENAEISLSFVSREEIRILNRQYRDMDNHTDVLSFPLIEDFTELDDSEEYMLGDVVICLEQVREQAKEYGHSEEREMVYLFVHSVCHLLGFDHMEEEEKAEMRQREEDVMEALGIGR